MKMNIEIDCSPAEARAFLGLPDVAAVNDSFTDAVASAMKGGAAPERMQEMAKAFSPMSELGLAMFNQFLKPGKTAE